MSEFDRDMLNEIERDEQWLASMATPAPSAEGIAAVKRAVDEALRRQDASAASRRWSSWSGVLAAAASIALAVCVGWYAVRSSGTGVNVADKRHKTVQPVEVEPAIPMVQDDAVVLWERMDENLSNLESWSQDPTWDLTGNELSSALEEIYKTDTSGNGADRRPNS